MLSQSTRIRLRIRDVYPSTPGEPDLEIGAFRHGVDAPCLRWWLRHAERVGLQGDDLERYTEYLRHLLTEPTVLLYCIAQPPQSSAHHLLTQQLGHERS